MNIFSIFLSLSSCNKRNVSAMIFIYACKIPKYETIHREMLLSGVEWDRLKQTAAELNPKTSTPTPSTSSIYSGGSKNSFFIFIANPHFGIVKWEHIYENGAICAWLTRWDLSDSWARSSSPRKSYKLKFHVSKMFLLKSIFTREP